MQVNIIILSSVMPCINYLYINNGNGQRKINKLEEINVWDVVVKYEGDMKAMN